MILTNYIFLYLSQKFIEKFKKKLPIVCSIQGMLNSRGRQLLFADADGATKFEDLSKLQTELKKIICGTDDLFIIPLSLQIHSLRLVLR